MRCNTRLRLIWRAVLFDAPCFCVITDRRNDLTVTDVPRLYKRAESDPINHHGLHHRKPWRSTSVDSLQLMDVYVSTAKQGVQCMNQFPSGSSQALLPCSMPRPLLFFLRTTMESDRTVSVDELPT